jgi:coenzyme F420 hydrogenase subunit beta
MGTLLQLCLGTVYAWSFFQSLLVSSYRWSYTDTAWAFSLAIFTLGISAAWAGVNLPAIGPRKLAVTGGSKPVLAQTLTSLEKACQQGIKQLLVIGASCHVQNLREFQRRSHYLRDMDLFVVGIPCTDNVHPNHFRSIFSKISRSHETVRHYEFMQDFTVHLRHVDGTLERVPFFSLPQDINSAELVTSCCRSCFDYMNGLADITVGYIGAPLDIEKMYQWVLVRTEKGEELRQLIADELETYP